MLRERELSAGLARLLRRCSSPSCPQLPPVAASCRQFRPPVVGGRPRSLADDIDDIVAAEAWRTTTAWLNQPSCLNQNFPQPKFCCDRNRYPGRKSEDDRRLRKTNPAATDSHTEQTTDPLSRLPSESPRQAGRSGACRKLPKNSG